MCIRALGSLLSARAPITAKQIAESIFDSRPRSIEAAKGLVKTISLARIDDPSNPDGVAPLPLRLHYFFHHAGRIWVCVNPNCAGRTGVTPPGAEEPPGKQAVYLSRDLFVMHAALGFLNCYTASLRWFSSAAIERLRT